MAQPRTPKGTRRHLAGVSAEGGECGTAGGAPRERRRLSPPAVAAGRVSRVSRGLGQEGEGWLGDRASPSAWAGGGRGRRCGAAVRLHPEGMAGVRARRLTQAAERATRSRRREPGLDAAAHEWCRFPAQASPEAGGGAPRRGGVSAWVGGRGPNGASRLVAGPGLPPAVGVGGRLRGTTHSLARTQAICSAPPPARLGWGGGSQRGPCFCPALRVDYRDAGPGSRWPAPEVDRNLTPLPAEEAARDLDGCRWGTYPSLQFVVL